MELQYKIISKFYDLLDVFYFNKDISNPRKCVLEYIPNEKIKLLEVCIGTATNSIIIAEKRRNIEITGIDLSEEMLEIGKEKIRKKGIKNVTTIIMDATEMKFDNNYFDVILISLVLHEVESNTRDKIMKEIERVLKRNGKLIIIEWEKPTKYFQKLLFLIIEALEPKWFKEFLNIDIKEYVKQFSLQVINEKKCDYTKIIEIKGE